MIHKSSVIDKKAEISKNVKIGGGSGVVQNIEDNKVVMGYPAVSLRKFLKNSKK